MARFSAIVASTFTLVLLFLVTVSQARVPSDFPEDDVIHRELTRSHAGSDVSSVLHLPSDSVNDDLSRSNQPAVDNDIPESESISAGSIPLRVATFRPINRHFPISSTFRFRNCRHRHHHHDHPFFMPFRGQRQQEHVRVPYGNDMILSTGESNEFDPFIFHHGRMRRIPAKWIKFHHHHHHDDHHEEDDDGFSKFVSKHRHRFGEEKFKKHLRHHEEEEDEDIHEEMKKRGRKREEAGSFMERIRKFLDHF